MKWFRKRIVSPILQRFVRFYFKKERKFNYKAINAVVLPGVFFPHFTLSTRFLLSYLETVNLEGKSFLELGCGTGVISVLAKGKGANVLATDINPKALENAQRNAKMNGVDFEVLLSDLFDNIASQQFNYIVINPPYYPKTPSNSAEKAWFCGEDFDYFEKLFSTMSEYLNDSSEVIMVLSEDCELDRIQDIGRQNNFSFSLLIEKKIKREKNFIFRISLMD